MFFEAEELPRGLFKACIVPRPIAWVSTVSKAGRHNLASLISSQKIHR